MKLNNIILFLFSVHYKTFSNHFHMQQISVNKINNNLGLIVWILILFLSCQGKNDQIKSSEKTLPRFEKINYYKNVSGQISENPFQSRVTYYFDNGKLHRWIELDSLGNALTDYIVNYDKEWNQSGSIYKEPDMEDYAIEKVFFPNDSTQVTEWLDSLGQVYYKMIDNLNEKGKTYRATFIGDKIHGYDSTFYTLEGFEKRIFFTNTKGKIFNDRKFQYNLINDLGDWVERKKIMKNTVKEIQKREISYDSHFNTKQGKFYEGIISTGEWDENYLSFTEKEDMVFFTRGKEWEKQFGFIAFKENGLYTSPQLLEEFDTIYNGAISPSGKRIIYCKRQSEKTEIWLVEKQNEKWLNHKNLTEGSEIEGGYFCWLDENNIYFYTPKNNGDLVVGKLTDGQLKIKDSLSTLNTEDGTEFSPYIDPNKKFLIFTRYKEGDKSQQGFFVSYNKGSYIKPFWSEPSKLNNLPYGWGAFCSKNMKHFFYTDGNDIYDVPFEKLELKL